MKHILTQILLFAALTLAAQNNYSPCYTNNMSKGNTAFSQGKYSEARTYYVNAKQCAGGNPTEAQKKINACDAKIKAQKEAAEAKKKMELEIQALAKTYTVNGVSFTMIYVQGGTFTMGCTSEQGNDCWNSEKPPHTVTESDFYIGETEVTQGLWKAVMNTSVQEQRNKAKQHGDFSDKDDERIVGEGATYPMYFISYTEALEFCTRLNILLKDELPEGYQFSLPTEAQWEYAARGGNKSRFYKYSGSNNVVDVARTYKYFGDPSNMSYPVKKKNPNELGLYDMSGNVNEFCLDWYDPNYYSNSPRLDPEGPSSSPYQGRVVRGGNWYNSGITGLRVSHRSGWKGINSRDNFTGFRLALSK